MVARPVVVGANATVAPLGMVLLGAVAGLLPARRAYSTDVAANL